MVINYCPHCGFHIYPSLVNGISSCCNCQRVFDSKRINQILSVSWAVRRQHIDDPQFLVNCFEVNEQDAAFIIEHVHDNCCRHEDFLKILKDTSHAIPLSISKIEDNYCNVSKYCNTSMNC